MAGYGVGGAGGGPIKNVPICEELLEEIEMTVWPVSRGPFCS